MVWPTAMAAGIFNAVANQTIKVTCQSGVEDRPASISYTIAARGKQSVALIAKIRMDKACYHPARAGWDTGMPTPLSGFTYTTSSTISLETGEVVTQLPGGAEGLSITGFSNIHSRPDGIYQKQLDDHAVSPKFCLISVSLAWARISTA